jgi:predicted HicB family RNase H-like nuclease
MTIQLQLKPEIEARIIAEATAQGLSVEAYLASLIENSLTSHEEKKIIKYQLRKNGKLY